MNPDFVMNVMRSSICQNVGSAQSRSKEVRSPTASEKCWGSITRNVSLASSAPHRSQPVTFTYGSANQFVQSITIAWLEQHVATRAVEKASRGHAFPYIWMDRQQAQLSRTILLILVLSATVQGESCTILSILFAPGADVPTAYTNFILSSMVNLGVKNMPFRKMPQRKLQVIKTHNLPEGEDIITTGVTQQAFLPLLDYLLSLSQRAAWNADEQLYKMFEIVNVLYFVDNLMAESRT